MERQRAGAGKFDRARRGVLHGASVTDADIRGWLHQAVSPQQSQGLPTDLPEDGLDLEGLINAIEKDLLIKALERVKWVKKKAARLLKAQHAVLSLPAGEICNQRRP